MKELIEESGLTKKEFAELYNIPYNTVLQWYNGVRQAPNYIKEMIKTIIKLRTNGVQLNISTGRTFNVIEKKMSTGSFYDIYEENSISFQADKNFWENEERKGGKYPPKIRTFKVQEIL